MINNWAGRAWRSFGSQLSNSRIGLGLVISSPAIFSWLAGLMVELSVDRRLRPIEAQIENLRTESDSLEAFVARFEQSELQRGTLNLLMTATNASEELRYLGDRVYRANSASIASLRRAASVVYPETWEEVLEPYQQKLDDGYATPEAVAELQGVDNDVMMKSRQRLTANQERQAELLSRVEALRDERRWMTMILQPLGLIFSLMAFVYNLKPKDVRPSAPPARRKQQSPT